MRAMVLKKVGQPLVLEELETPRPEPDEVLLRIEACAVCRTDLHIFLGELKPPHLPLILGHQIVGTIDALGSQVTGWREGQRVGVTWLSGSCAHCARCLEGNENLCSEISLTGYTHNGGFAQFCTAKAAYLLPIEGDPVAMAPLLCAGVIGMRALRFCGDAKRIGFYGFGAAAHLLAQVVTRQGRELYVFSRKGSGKEQLARSLGAKWVGASDERPKELLDAAILFAPSGELIPLALNAIRKGGALVLAEIHMSPIPSFPYELLWGEKRVIAVANLTRADGQALLQEVKKAPIETHTTVFPLEKANEALLALQEGDLLGSAVLDFRLS